MRATLTILLVLLAVAAATGCGDDEEPGTTTGQSSDPVLVDYTRTGGIAGVQEHLVLFKDGRGTFLRGDAGPAERFTLPGAERAAVAASLAKSGFAQLPRVQRTIPEPDGFNYVITHDGHTLFRESAGLEAQLQPVVRRLDAIAAAH